MMKNDIRLEIGMRIRQLRQENGLTIEATAHLAGIHPNYLGEAERGKKNLNSHAWENRKSAAGAGFGNIFR